jgi:hypothetical protein
MSSDFDWGAKEDVPDLVKEEANSLLTREKLKIRDAINQLHARFPDYNKYSTEILKTMKGIIDKMSFGINSLLAKTRTGGRHRKPSQKASKKSSKRNSKKRNSKKRKTSKH